MITRPSMLSSSSIVPFSSPEPSIPLAGKAWAQGPGDPGVTGF